MIIALKKIEVQGELSPCTRDDGSIFGYKDATGEYYSCQKMGNGYYHKVGGTDEKEEVIIFFERFGGKISNYVRQTGGAKLDEFRKKFPNRKFELRVHNLFGSDFKGSREISYSNGSEYQIVEIKEPSIEWLMKKYPTATKFIKK